MPPPSTVLVVGATGKQGGAVLKALLALPSPPATILALTRNTSSPRAQALATAHPGRVSLVQGDTVTPDPIFASRQKGSIDSIFLMTTPPNEEKQAIPFLDAAAAHGVRHVVFSSVDRGGDQRSWENPTDIKHFYEKHNIELHLRDKVAASMKWTILRPTAFLDNMNPGFFCSAFVSMWGAALSPERKLQLVSVRDIGVWAARALVEPERFEGRAIGLASDEMTLAEAKLRFHKATGKDLPSAWGIVGSGQCSGPSARWAACLLSSRRRATALTSRLFAPRRRICWTLRGG